MVSTPGIVVAMGEGYISADMPLGFRSYGRLAICEMGGYGCGWLVMASLPKDREREGGAGYDDQCMSSRDGVSPPTGVAPHVADGGGPCGV